MEKDRAGRPSAGDKTGKLLDLTLASGRHIKDQTLVYTSDFLFNNDNSCVMVNVCTDNV